MLRTSATVGALFCASRYKSRSGTTSGGCSVSAGQKHDDAHASGVQHRSPPGVGPHVLTTRTSVDEHLGGSKGPGGARQAKNSINRGWLDGGKPGFLLWIYSQRRYFPMVTDLAIWPIALFTGAILKLVLNLGQAIDELAVAVLVALLVHGMLGWATGLYRRRWRISSFDEISTLGDRVVGHVGRAVPGHVLGPAQRQPAAELGGDHRLPDEPEPAVPGAHRVAPLLGGPSPARSPALPAHDRARSRRGRVADPQGHGDGPGQPLLPGGAARRRPPQAQP